MLGVFPVQKKEALTAIVIRIFTAAGKSTTFHDLPE